MAPCLALQEVISWDHILKRPGVDSVVWESGNCPVA